MLRNDSPQNQPLQLLPLFASVLVAGYVVPSLPVLVHFMAVLQFGSGDEVRAWYKLLPWTRTLLTRGHGHLRTTAKIAEYPTFDANENGMAKHVEMCAFVSPPLDQLSECATYVFVSGTILPDHPEPVENTAAGISYRETRSPRKLL